MPNKLSLQDLSLQGKRVLMRVDFNVPLNKDGTIADDSRIKAAITSIQYILGQGGKLILMSHMGRPKGKRDSKYTLRPCAKRLSELLNQPVMFSKDCIGQDTEEMSFELENGQAMMLENLRFHIGEEHPEKEPSFAQKLARLGDIYVNDAFGACHRNHSSVTTITKYFPDSSAAGFLLDKEIAFLGTIVFNPKRPFHAIIGGAKISTKIGVIGHLIDKIDGLFIGGGMAYTFLKAQGIEIGDSLFEESEINTVKEIINRCQEKAVQLWLPSDIVIADAFLDTAETKTISAKESIPNGWQGLDIGPKTVSDWKNSLQNASTIFWNGPMGAFEMSTFAKGTEALAEALAKATATTIVGGGDSVSCIRKMGIADQFTHLSTGGGASLEYLEHGKLPGIEALTNR